jgi:hypothetical protein
MSIHQTQLGVLVSGFCTRFQTRDAEPHKSQFISFKSTKTSEYQEQSQISTRSEERQPMRFDWTFVLISSMGKWTQERCDARRMALSPSRVVPRGRWFQRHLINSFADVRCTLLDFVTEMRTNTGTLSPIVRM